MDLNSVIVDNDLLEIFANIYIILQLSVKYYIFYHQA